MSRVRATEGPGISLFPFLAVLLCTMGALLVLLVIFSRSAAGNREAADAAVLEELAVQRDALAWRREQLAQMRQQTLDDLARARLQLAGIEDTSRRMSDELTALEQELRALASNTAKDEERDAEELEKLAARLAETERELAEARDSAAERPPAYAVVPYEGEHGTHRRPLYIECSLDGVFLQPEGIRLSPSDFEGPAGPGNPLASALRAAREHLAERGRASAVPEQQPYPLLLVRPSGVMAYYAAREAISSWGSDFGYQFIEEDWQLAFPPADRQLADVERRAIDEARSRLAWLAQTQAARFSRKASPKVQYRAATTRGGVVVDGGPSVLGDQSRWDWTEEAASGQAGRSGQGGGVFGSASGGGPGSQARLADDVAFGGGSGGSVADGQAVGSGGEGPGGDPLLGSGGTGSQAGTGSPGGTGPAAVASMADAEQRGERLSMFGMQGMAAGEPEAPAGGANGVPSSGTAGSGSSLAASGTGQTGSGQAARAGGPGSAAGSTTGGESGGSSSDTASGGGGQFGDLASGMASSSAVGGSAGGSSAMGQQGGTTGVAGMVGSLASSRGSNWASMATHDRPIPLSRPVQVECDRDEFRILDDGRRRVLARVPAGGRTSDAVDPLIGAIRSHVDGWGIAGDRMYWNPRLVLSATPDGVARRDDLESLLTGSGLVTVRRGAKLAAASGDAAGGISDETVR